MGVGSRCTTRARFVIAIGTGTALEWIDGRTPHTVSALVAQNALSQTGHIHHRCWTRDQCGGNNVLRRGNVLPTHRVRIAGVPTVDEEIQVTPPMMLLAS